MRRIFACALLALLPPAAGGAQAPPAAIRLEPDRLAAGELTTLRLELSGGFSPRTPPALKLVNFELVAGPSIENRFEWVNGRASSGTILLYRLRALKPGTATVESMHLVDSSGKAVDTPAVSAEVEKESAGGPSRLSAASSDPALVARLEPPSPYEGQQAVWTLYLLTRGEARQAEVKSLPDFRGFWAEDLDREQNVTPRVWNLNGVAWRAYPLARKALFPNRAGAIPIGPAEAVASLRPEIFDIFGNFPFGETQSVARSSPALTVTCRALPAGRSGLPVGAFSLKASLERRQVGAGESTTLTAVLTGDGRLNDLSAPAVAAPGARISEPETRLSWKRSGSRLTSSRQWQWIVTPERPGALEIAPIRVEVFDPSSQKVLTAASGPLALTALAPPAPEPPRPAPAALPAAAPENLPAGAVRTAGLAAAALALLALGFLMGRRRHAHGLAAPGIRGPSTPEDRIADCLERIASDRRLERRTGAREELARLSRRFDEIRYGPELSSREEAARQLEGEVARLARSLRIRV